MGQGQTRHQRGPCAIGRRCGSSSSAKGARGVSRRGILDARRAAWQAKNPPPFKARLYSHKDQRIDNKAYKLPKAQADEIVAACRTMRRLPSATIERKEVRRSPAPPFITSRLQQEACTQAVFLALADDEIAQRLYEGMELGDHGAVGLITYMRTDSPRVSDVALDAVRGHIAGRYGKDYLPDRAHSLSHRQAAQDAHEAIRPTAVERDPESMASLPAKDGLELYKLIYDRFVSSQMNPAVYDRTSVDIAVGRRGLPRHRPSHEIRRLHARLSRGPG